MDTEETLGGGTDFLHEIGGLRNPWKNSLLRSLLKLSMLPRLNWELLSRSELGGRREAWNYR